MIKRYNFSTERVVESTEESAPICVYVSPTDAEKRFLIDTLKLDEHTLKSAMDPHELARVEFEPDHAALIIKIPRRYNSSDNFLFSVMSLGLYFDSRLIVVSARIFHIRRAQTHSHGIGDGCCPALNYRQPSISRHVKVIASAARR